MLPPPRDEPGPDSPGLRNGAREGTQAAGSAGLIAAVTLQPYRLYGWFKPLAEVPIYLANTGVSSISSPMIRSNISAC